jgi:hypothetical protein
MEKESISRSPRGRVTRTPVSQRNILTVRGKEAGYEYRVVNDIGDRVQMFEEAGYEVVNAGDITVGDKRVSKASPVGSKAEVSVGAGEKAVVMRIREDWYKEDQLAKQQRINELEASMIKNARNGFTGKIETTRS